MKMKYLFFALLMATGFVSLSAQASYYLVFKAKGGCPEGQVLVQDLCVGAQSGSGDTSCAATCQSPSVCLPNGE